MSRVRVWDECPQCGAKFARKYQSGGVRKLCCSRKCAVEASRVTINCKTCDKPFIVVHRKHNRDFCSITCMRGKPCLVCGKTITGWPYSQRDKHTPRKFCSRKCGNLYRFCRTGNDGYYTALGFFSSLKRRGTIMCERCSITEVQYLCVHHRDRNRKNNTPGNLETLCLNCHSDEHNGKSKLRKLAMRRVDMLRRFPELTSHISDWALE